MFTCQVLEAAFVLPVRDMDHDCRAGVKDGKDGYEDDQVDAWCFPERNIAQHRTENMHRCRGNWGCDEKMQTEVAWLAMPVVQRNVLG